jgi:hypothetical protein
LNAPNIDVNGGSNSGGGGGAVGRIRVVTQAAGFSDQGTISPPPSTATF